MLQLFSGLVQFSRPPDIVVGGLKFYRDSSSSIYLSIFRQLPFELAVRNVGYPLPLKIVGRKSTFFNDVAT